MRTPCTYDRKKAKDESGMHHSRVSLFALKCTLLINVTSNSHSPEEDTRENKAPLAGFDPVTLSSSSNNTLKNVAFNRCHFSNFRFNFSATFSAPISKLISISHKDMDNGKKMPFSIHSFIYLFILPKGPSKS